MTDALTHRGPDASGYHTDGPCTLGHRRLSVIDLSEAANQPMTDQSGRYTMVYNGEVYNYRDIAKELDLSLRTASDSEVVIEAFAKWGPAFVEKLNGMFAIAIWDSAKKELHLFRDRIGIKPLYWGLVDNRLVFASELKGITAVSELRQRLELDDEALGHYLHIGFVPEPYSIWKQLRKFPKGHRACYRLGGPLVAEPYWSLKDQFKPQCFRNEAEATDELERLVVSAVHMRMMSDVPFGTFLSGGVDSSLVTAIAQTHSPEPVRTFSIGFEEGKYNEMPFANEVSDYLDTRHYAYVLKEKEAIDMVPGLMQVYDEPFADSSAIPTMLVSKMARKDVTVALTGDGGDETFMGYNTYLWANRLSRPYVQALHGPLGIGLRMGNDKMRRAAWLFEQRFGPKAVTHLFSQEQYLFSARQVDKILKSPYDPLPLLPDPPAARPLQPHERQAYFDLERYLPDDLLVKVDRAAMHFGLETRVPLLDHRIVTFGLNLDPDLRLNGAIVKYLLKKVLYRYVPESYFDRIKWGFAIPLDSWMRNALNPFIEDQLHSKALGEVLGAAPADIPAVRKWRNGDELYYNRVWQLAVLGQFLDTFR